MIKIFDPARDIKEQPSEITELNTYGGSIFSGATIDGGDSVNIKRFNHWSSASATGSFYHSAYSAHYTASAAVELANFSFGYSVSSSFFGATNETNGTEKNKIYRLYAKMFLGDENQRFVIDGAFRDNLIFLSIPRGLRKDEIKKETITLKSVRSGSTGHPTVLDADEEMTWTDTGANTSYTKSHRGDYAEIKSGSLVSGLVFYQAGVLALIPEVFSNTSSLTTNPGNLWSGSFDYPALALSGAGVGLDRTLDGVRYRFRNLSFINKTILHSTLYFCRAFNYEFNYSSNPTFIDADRRIIPTSGSSALTRTYFTKVGLYGMNNELLGVGSLSEPIKKGPDIERTIVVRLDY